MFTSMANMLVGIHQVAIVDVDEGILEESRTHLNGFLVKIRHITCMYNMLS